MRLIEKLGLAAVLVVLLLLITCTATPQHPESPLSELIQITALPTARAERPIVVVITPEPVTSLPDPKFFLIVTVVDAALNPLPGMITLEFPATGRVREVGPAPKQLFPIPIDGEEHFIVRASAEGYQPIQQEFRVSLNADADYELVLVLQPAVTPTPGAPEAWDVGDWVEAKHSSSKIAKAARTSGPNGEIEIAIGKQAMLARAEPFLSFLSTLFLTCITARSG